VPRQQPRRDAPEPHQQEEGANQVEENGDALAAETERYGGARVCE